MPTVVVFGLRARGGAEQLVHQLSIACRHAQHSLWPQRARSCALRQQLGRARTGSHEPRTHVALANQGMLESKKTRSQHHSIHGLLYFEYHWSPGAPGHRVPPCALESELA